MTLIAWKSGLRVLLAEDDLLTPTLAIAGCGVAAAVAAAVVQRRGDRGLVVRRDSVEFCPQCQRPRPRAPFGDADPNTPRCGACGRPSPQTDSE